MSNMQYQVENYNYYVNQFKEISIQNGKKISSSNLKKYNLPDYRWFLKHCPNPEIKCWNDFLIWVGFCIGDMSMEDAKVLIYNYSDQLKRPLMYDDFRGSNPLIPSISYINSHWGSLNKMKNDLGLEIIQENMSDKQLSKDEFIKQMEVIFNISKNNDIQFITRNFIDAISDTNNSCSLDKYSHRYFNMSLSDYIKSCGFESGKCGCGCIYRFDDGELTSSQYEYLFSKYLRSIGLIYQKDYFRSVRYSDFIKDYKGMMDCDYVINFNNNTIYIEIPGIIEYYKSWYYDDKKISSSESKEKYRQKIKLKENLLKSNNLKYFLLFPCDLTKDNLIKILENPTDELREEISKFINYNISWSLVLDVGELKYDSNISRKRNPVIYKVGDIDGTNCKTF